jgi:hypothetical protein
VTWAELIRKLKAAGFVEVRSGKGEDAGRLGNRIFREAGVE